MNLKEFLEKVKSYKIKRVNPDLSKEYFVLEGDGKTYEFNEFKVYSSDDNDEQMFVRYIQAYIKANTIDKNFFAAEWDEDHRDLKRAEVWLQNGGIKYVYPFDGVKFSMKEMRGFIADPEKRHTLVEPIRDYEDIYPGKTMFGNEEAQFFQTSRNQRVLKELGWDAIFWHVVVGDYELFWS